MQIVSHLQVMNDDKERIYSLFLLSFDLTRSFASIVVMLTEATMPCITEIKVLIIATGALTTAKSLNDETPRTAKVCNKCVTSSAQ